MRGREGPKTIRAIVQDHFRIGICFFGNVAYNLEVSTAGGHAWIWNPRTGAVGGQIVTGHAKGSQLIKMGCRFQGRTPWVAIAY